MPAELLKGIRVIDFTWALVGPRTTKMLSDYGAEVIRVEGRTRIDVQRITGPFKDDIPGENRAGRFQPHSTGKLSVALNLALPKGLDVAKRLIALADIVVENFSGGTIKKMGLGYEELKKIKPDIIMLSSCGMGQGGPYASFASFGVQLAALSGFDHITGWPDQEPVDLGVYTDFIAPHFNILTILAALDYRRRTGKGQYIDMAQYENAIHFMSPLILDNVVNKRVSTREGNRLPSAAPHNAYRCLGEDRWCAIAVFTDREWEGFCKVIGNPVWIKDPRFSTLQARKENEEALDRLIGEWTMNHTAEEIMHMMQAEDVSAGVLQTTEDLQDHDPQLKDRHFYWELDHPEVGKYRAPGPSFILSKSPCELRSAPLLGEHIEYVFMEVLSMSDHEIEELLIDGVIE